MKIRWLYALPKFLFAFFLLLSTVTACSIFAGKPTVIIASPPSGSQFRENEEVAVQSTSTDSSGVARVELLIDGTVVRTDPSPSPQVSFTLIQTWKATPGTHTISVRAYNTSGAVSEPAAVSISVAQVAVPVLITPTPPGAPTPIAAATATTAPAGCTNDAQFDRDVTVPDGTMYAAGQTFDKIWRLRNSGACAWGAGYQFVFVGGTAMTTNTVINVPATASGATADLKVSMTAPSTPGTHIGTWQMRSPTGTFFGARVTVKIVVPAPTGCVGTPNIASFSASATTITAGMAITLNWGAVTGAESAEIDQGIGGVETPGSRVVNPTTTTTYTLTAKCGSNVKTAKVTITVNPAPVACSGAPVIVSFSAANPTIKVGASTTLNWGAVNNADSVEINQGIGGVATPGSASISPITNTTYILTAKCGTNTDTRQVTVTVTP
ncbi:MAG: NBR1-Ig-like domain-containing protein [Chloroflexota bacterium]